MPVPVPHPRVSVVIPAWNYGRYLRQTIESVLAQTFADWELTVIDDGSVDDTRAVVEAFTDPRLRYFWQSNAGLSAARNAGLRQARGEFIAFLDADDLWEPRFLETTVRQLSELGSAWGLVATEVERIDATGGKLPRARHHEQMRFDGELTARRLCLRNRPFPSAVLARRAIFARAGEFDVTLRSSEDRDMWIRAAEQTRFRFLSEPLVLIRRHAENMSKNAPRMRANTLATLRKAEARGTIPRHELLYRARVWSVFHFQIAWTHFDAGYRAAAFRYLAVSWLLCPFFFTPRAFDEPAWFRLRALRQFVLRALRRPAPLPSTPAPVRATALPT